MDSKTLKESEIRKLVKRLLEDSSLGPTLAVRVNPVVDPSASLTNPDNENYKPNTRQELQISLGTMLEDVPDEKIPDIYDSLKDALDAKQNEEGKEQMEKSNKKVEEAIRLAVRKILSEAPPVRKFPFGHSAFPKGPNSPQVVSLRNTLDNMQIDEPDETRRGDEPAQGRTRRNVTMTDVQGASFDGIAKELGFSVSAAKLAVEKALQKARFTMMMDPEDLEILVLKSMSDYIDMLSSSGELSAADVKLLKDHPDIVRELDGFREFLDKAIRTEKKAHKKDEEEEE
jgi:hypothetical protein